MECPPSNLMDYPFLSKDLSSNRLPQAEVGQCELSQFTQVVEYKELELFHRESI